MSAKKFILVTGASGRLGAMLRGHWPAMLPENVSPLWQSRAQACAADWVAWDILNDPWRGSPLDGGAVLALAGITRGDADALAANTTLALAACRAATEAGAAHVFVASSAAVYGPSDGRDLDEDAPTRPANAYGAAKLAMERAVLDWKAAQGLAAPGVTLLRIGNVVGADALIGGAMAGREVVLDPLPEHPGGPVRSWIGPKSLARVLAQLCLLAMEGRAMPQVLNVAAPGGVAMADLLEAAGLHWRYGPDNPGVVPRVVLDTARLQHLVPLPPEAATPEGLLGEWLSTKSMSI